MPRRFPKRRTFVIAAITVALSVGIVFASVPYLPHSIAPHGHLASAISHSVPGGDQTRPGFFALSLPGVSNNESFAVGVTVTGGAADFCVLTQFAYDNWVASYSTSANPGSTISSACIPQRLMGIIQSVISFKPPSSGTYDVAALNANPQNVTVTFSPA